MSADDRPLVRRYVVADGWQATELARTDRQTAQAQWEAGQRPCRADEVEPGDRIVTVRSFLGVLEIRREVRQVASVVRTSTHPARAHLYGAEAVRIELIGGPTIPVAPDAEVWRVIPAPDLDALAWVDEATAQRDPPDLGLGELYVEGS